MDSEKRKNMLYFRVDANPEIATGHVMRCLSIAMAAKSRGIESMFIVADEWGKKLIEEKGFPIYCLNSDWKQKEDELLQLCSYLCDEKAKMLIVDSYQVTDAYIEKLREYVKVVYIDDIDKLRVPADILINYNNYGSDEEFRNRYRQHLGADAKLLLGCEYAPLREEFRQRIPQFTDKVRGVFLSTGGADKFHIGLRLVEELLKRGLQTDIHIVAGSFHTDKEVLRELANLHSNCILHENVTNMSEIMTMCDIAVSAGGSTTYELCACGIPMILFSFADNQLSIVKTHDKQGTAIYCGDYRDEKEGLIKRIADMVFVLEKDVEKRRKLYQKSMALVDGKGALRIVEALLG